MTTYDSKIFHGAHKVPSLVFITTILSFLCPFCQVMAIPTGNVNIGSQLKGWRQQPESSTTSDYHSPERFIVTANTNILLQIEENGKVSGTKCKTEYAALQTKTHTITSGGQQRVIMVIFATKSRRYLCMSPEGRIYSETEDKFHEENCGFRFDGDWVNKKDEHGKTIVYDLARLRHHRHKKSNNSLYLGLKCDGTPFVVHGCRAKQYYKKDIRFNYGDFKKESVREQCNSTPTCKRTYLKFCRNVMKNFFTTSVKNWRRFKKRKCFKVLKKAESKRRAVDRRCDPRRPRRHRKRSRRTR